LQALNQAIKVVERAVNLDCYLEAFVLACQGDG
jgi:hypothetical protein